MKIKNNVITFIKQAITLANSLGIEDICFETNLVRAMPPCRSIFIVHNHDIELPFYTIGITRIPQLLSRLNIITESDDYNISFTDNDGEVRSLNMKCPNTNITFKCSNPSKIIAPRKVNDPMMFDIDISSEFVDMLKRGQNAMKAEYVILISKDDEVFFEINDVNNDTFKYLITKNITCIEEDGEDTSFDFKYPIKLLITLLKGDITNIKIGESGTMCIINKDGFTIYIPPRV